MTRIDFYLVESAAPGEKARLACRLADKAYRLGRRVYLLTPDEERTREIDDLLWTFSPGSFTPHAIAGSAPLAAPVLLGQGPPPDDQHDVLISLAPEVRDFFSRFDRVAELVGADEDDRTRGRTKFRFYRDRGYPLETHKVER